MIDLFIRYVEFEVIAAYEIAAIVFRIWALGILLWWLISISHFIYAQPHSFGMLLKRLGFCLIWPLALASRAGRSRLWGNIKEVQP